MTVVAMSIDTGTHDLDAAREIAQALDLRLVDMRHFEIELAQRSDFGDAGMMSFVKGRTRGSWRWSMSVSQLTARVREEILQHALGDDILIVGWVAPAVLRPVRQVATIRICAARPARECNVMRDLAYRSTQIAQLEIDSGDALIWRFVQRIAEADYTDPELYDLVLNSAAFDAAACASLVRLLIQMPRFHCTETTRRGMLKRIEQLLAREQPAVRRNAPRAHRQLRTRP